MICLFYKNPFCCYNYALEKKFSAVQDAPHLFQYVYEHVNKKDIVDLLFFLFVCVQWRLRAQWRQRYTSSQRLLLTDKMNKCQQQMMYSKREIIVNAP